MAHFYSPCERSSLIQADSAPMPTLAISTYTHDYVKPSLQVNRHQAMTSVAKPPDCLDESAGRRILPTTFRDFYKNCASASIGDQLELQFTDDTPEWKRLNRAAVARNWIHPLEERKRFGETKMKSAMAGDSGAKNDQQSGDGYGMGESGDMVFEMGDAYAGNDMQTDVQYSQSPECVYAGDMCMFNG